MHPFNEEQQIKRKSVESKQKLREHRKKLMDSIGADAFNGVNIFENTTPAPAQRRGSKAGAVDLGDPGDGGVDISSLVGGASQLWKAMK